MLDSFLLKWQAAVAVDLNLWYISSNSTSCNVMNFLCFLGALLASLLALCMGPTVLVGLWYCTKHDEKYMRTARDHFLL